MGELEAGGEEGAEVGAEGAVVIDDADAAVFGPHGAFVEVVVDGVVEAGAVFVLNPAGFAAGGVEAIEIGDEEAAAGLEDAGHFVDGGMEVADVDEGEVADEEMEELIGKGRCSAAAWM